MQRVRGKTGHKLHGAAGVGVEAELEDAPGQFPRGAQQ